MNKDAKKGKTIHKEKLQINRSKLINQEKEDWRDRDEKKKKKCIFKRTYRDGGIFRSDFGNSYGHRNLAWFRFG